MLYFTKIFKFPNPKQLGMSDHCNGMAMRGFGDDDGSKTWEDYYDYLQKTYPVKFFFASTLPVFFRDAWLRIIGWKLQDFYYWFQSFIIRRDHIVDLRQPKSNEFLDVDYYRSGWIDADTKMVFAWFNILNNFVENEMNHYYCPSLEEIIKEPHLKSQRDKVIEIKDIYHWWHIERKRDHKKEDNLLTEWHNAKKVKSPNAKMLWEEMKQVQKANEDKLEEMLLRLLKIRKSLWS